MFCFIVSKLIKCSLKKYRFVFTFCVCVYYSLHFIVNCGSLFGLLIMIKGLDKGLVGAEAPPKCWKGTIALGFGGPRRRTQSQFIGL